MPKVNIKDLDKIELLYALWLNARVPCSLPHPEFNYVDAPDVIKKYINYYHGRSIKCNISGDLVDAWLYDRDYGAGSFEKIVNQLREKNQ